MFILKRGVGAEEEHTLDIYVCWPISFDVWFYSFSTAVEGGVIVGGKTGCGGVEVVEC